MNMKTYIATWDNSEAEFSANDLKEAKKLASFHKRQMRGGIVGKTNVRLKAD